MEAISVIEDAKRIHDLLAAAAAAGPLGDRPEPVGGGERGLSAVRAEDLITDIRAGRDAR